MLECTNRFEDRAFLLLLAGVSLAFLWMLRPFFDVIFWSIVIALLATPVYDALQRRGRLGRNLASLTCVLLSLVLIIVPCAYIFYTFINEAASLYARLTAGGHDIHETLEKLRQVAPGVQEWLTRYGYGPEVINQKLSELAVRISGLVARNTVALGGSTVTFIVDLCIVLYLAFFLVRDGQQLRVLLIRALPFGDHRENLLFAKFAEVLRATVKGSLLVAMAQGALGGLIFWILGIKAPVLWGVVMTLLSLIPVVGAGVVWAPVAVYLLLTGDHVSGVVLLAYGVFVIGLADNILRPVLVGRDTKLPDFMVLLSTLGGFSLFGMDGFVTGPMLAVLFVTVWKIFMDEFKPPLSLDGSAPEATAPNGTAPGDKAADGDGRRGDTA